MKTKRAKESKTKEIPRARPPPAKTERGGIRSRDSLERILEKEKVKVKVKVKGESRRRIRAKERIPIKLRTIVQARSRRGR